MSNAILFVKDAGRGATPPCPASRFKPGDVVKIRNTRALATFPREAVVLCVVPPGFPAAYALADLVGEPRPLMITEPSRVVSYILVNEGDPTPYIARDRHLLPSGKEPVQIGTVKREGAQP